MIAPRPVTLLLFTSDRRTQVAKIETRAIGWPTYVILGSPEAGTSRLFTMSKADRHRVATDPTRAYYVEVPSGQVLTACDDPYDNLAFEAWRQLSADHS